MTTISACGSGLRATRGRVCIRHSPVLARAAELDEPANERSSAKGLSAALSQSTAKAESSAIRGGDGHDAITNTGLLESTATAILDPSRLGPVSGGA